MQSTYHFKSAADIDMDVLNAIKTAYKEKPVVLMVEEEGDDSILYEAQKKFVLNSIKEYIEHPELLVNEHDAWEMINTGE